MNIYDEAHNLAHAIKESEQYKQYTYYKDEASKNPELSEMLNNFQAKQFEMQAKTMMGENLGDDMMAQVQELYAIIMKDPLAAQYMQAQVAFSMMINDVYKILGEVIQFNDGFPKE